MSVKTDTRTNPTVRDHEYPRLRLRRGIYINNNDKQDI